MHVGTMIPHFKKGDFNKLLIPTPDRSTQKFIGDAYMALVEKIELNRRINETLEATARTIFKDWFVDFGPTRAKMEGQSPYLAPDLWGLFPDRLDDECNPEGWNSGSLVLLKQHGDRFGFVDSNLPLIRAGILVQGILEVLRDPDVVHHQSRGLVVEHPIDASNRLHERRNSVPKQNQRR